MEQEQAARRISGWHLGQTSERFEAPGSGPGEISTGSNDRGGVSYGAYQLSSKTGTLQEYLAQSAYGPEFKGLTPATAEFDTRWREIAAADPAFGQDQHDFIGRSHYQSQLQRLDRMGLSLEGRGRAVQDALWSTAVQFRDLTPKILVGALTESFGSKSKFPDLTDRQIVSAIQDYKVRHNEDLFRSSPHLWRGLLARASAEKVVLLGLADAEMLVKGGLPMTYPSSDRRKVPEPTTQENASIERQQRELKRLGYSGVNGAPLDIDNQLGPNTLHAIKSFQRAHHLHVDGIAGKHTLAALEDAQRWPLLSEATHPQHRLYAQVEQGIRKLPSHGRSSDMEIENAAVALTIAAHTSGLRQVDHVVLGSNGVNLFAVQGRMEDPGHRRVHVELAHAVAHAVDHRSMAISHPAPEHLHGVALAQQQAPPRTPVMAGP